jgi:HK97 family phage prohead protease
MDIERRTIPNTSVEVRAADDAPTKLTGRAVPYNVLSRDLGGFREQFAPGAFDNVLKNSDARALFNHNPDNLLGRESAGTLKLRDSKDGLDYTVDPLPDTSVARDVAENVRLKNIQGNSFAFSVGEGGDVWDRDDDGVAIRTVTNVSGLYDVGPVTEPAYEDGTTVSTRSLELAKAVKPPMNLIRAKQEAAERRLARRCRCTETRGASLGALLSQLIDSKAESGNMTVEEVEEAAGSAAGISGSTVGQIKSGSIVCPPIRRLEALAKYLGVSVGRLTAAAERDGCDYSS